jgi:hypothetical protein
VLFVDLPVAVVDEPVVEPAQVDAVCDVGSPAAAVPVDVVGVGGWAEVDLSGC